MSSNLELFIQKIDEVKLLLDLMLLGVAGGGVIDFKQRLEFALEEIEEKKENGTLALYLSQIVWLKKYDKYKNDRKAILKEFSFNFEAELKSIVAEEDFIDSWNQLDEHNKTTLLFLSSDAYGELRSKLETKDFNFVFKDFYENMPLEWLEKWLAIPAGHKVSFFKLKKESEGKEYEFFYKNEIYQKMNDFSCEKRNIEIKKYLPEIRKEIDKNTSSNFNWYYSIDLLFGDYLAKHFLLYLGKHEDDFNGLNKLSEMFNYPKVIEKWAPTLRGIPRDLLTNEHIKWLEKNQETGWSEKEMEEFKKEAKESGVEDFFDDKFKLNKLSFSDREKYAQTFFKEKILSKKLNIRKKI